VIGDGGFAMSGMELLTAVRERLDLVLFVLHDGHLGRVRLAQIAAFGRTSSVDLHNPDFREFARAVGATYHTWHADLPLRSVLERRGVTLVDVRVTDSPDLETVRMRGLISGTVRRLVGPELLHSLKRRVFSATKAQ
jgi:acetolactate synthase-1/2/3 large subunit